MKKQERPAVPSPRPGLIPFGDDPFLAPFRTALDRRRELFDQRQRQLTEDRRALPEFAAGHEHFGLNFRNRRWRFREWAPNATAVWLIGDFSQWRECDEYRLQPTGRDGQWSLELAPEALQHGQLYRLSMHWPGGQGDRIPAWSRRVVQDPNTKIFNAQVWHPPQPHRWRNPEPCGGMPAYPLVYEAHVGMAQENPGVGTFNEFTEDILPRIVEAGYNTIQLMAILEHPYYASFGYQVSSFFAASSRFGTPEELKELIDAAHGCGLAVIIDLVHSHAAPNEVEGLARFDGTACQYFHAGDRGRHPAWGSMCFDYGKPEVLHFLLSNCRFWLDEYRIDGFRFDGVTSMLYHDHGLGVAFASYQQYFDHNVDEDALAYLALANRLIHQVRPDAITVAEDMSGMPGLGAPTALGGCAFDFRLAMGIPDCWFKLLRECRDEDWDLTWLFHELTNRRRDECTISYVESHDQAIVGGKTAIFELVDTAIYRAMRKQDRDLLVDRGMALHKLMRLATIATAGHGYLNFIGNEFGHPEWIDFPREGNQWSYHHARRLWSLRDDPQLRFHWLADFDRAMLRMIRAHSVVGNPLLRVLLVDNSRKLLLFERGELFFLFNFNPSQSFVDLHVEVPPGSYTLLLNSDAAEFGGHGRVVSEQSFTRLPVPELTGDNLRESIKVYLPTQTALVLRRGFGQPD